MSMRLHRTGFSLIELLMVIVIAAIMAAVAAPFLFRGGSVLTAGAMAKKVKDDIRYAQSLALLRSNLDTPSATNPKFAYRIRFNVADANCSYTNQYTIVNNADNNATWGENPNGAGIIESARNPANGDRWFCVQMDSGDYAGFVASADFGGATPGILEFDNMGIPYDSDGNKLTASKTVQVTKGAETITITVTPNTGRVSIQ
ncbi:MAG: prepilin-type N-terminal cleavage/methylation domain-containing protein [Deltaproteobacteria bacterium]|nr:prepilin-type N-terminal cleavage/methylation domain-containing protein [Deltaproteobacteria bacterium]